MLCRRAEDGQIIRTSSGVSFAALARLQESWGKGGSQRTRRRRFTNAIAATADTMTAHGTLVQYLELHIDGTATRHPYIHPMALLSHLGEQCPHFAVLLQKHCSRGMNRIAVYVDEIKPGNPLRPDSGRSLECVYWNLMELPGWWRSRRNGWFVLTTILSAEVQKLDGGISALFKQLMNVIWSVSTWNFRTMGVRIACPSGEFLLRASFACFLGDEKALKEVWSVKGASGTKPCCSRRNVVGRMEVARDDPHIVHYTSATGFRAHTDRSYAAMIASLKEHAATSTRATLDNLSQVYGITYNTSSIMFDERLLKFATPATGTYWDWMHILVASGGVLQYEANQLVRSIVQARVGLAELDEFASKMVLPAHLVKLGKSYFQQRVVDKPGAHIHAFASEMFLVADALYLFITKVLEPANLLLEHCRCFKLMCGVLQTLKAGDSAVQEARPLRHALQAHHGMFMRLYEDCAKPKLHYAKHIPDMLAKGVNLSCFSTERKHREVKRIAHHTFVNISTHVVSRLLNDCIQQISEEDSCNEIHLQGTTHELPKVLCLALGDDVNNCVVSHAAKFTAGDVKVGDVLRTCVGEGDIKVGIARSFLQVNGAAGCSWFVHVSILTKVSATQVVVGRANRLACGLAACSRDTVLRRGGWRLH